MSGTRNRNKTIEEFELFSDADFSPDEFIETMEGQDQGRMVAGRSRPARRRLDDWYEWRRMRENLEDWEDWETEPN